MNKPPRLNILTLPPFTAILFALMALVILGAGFASMLPGSQIWWPLVVLPLVLLPLRDFLHWPDREKRQDILRTVGEDEKELQTAVDDLSGQADMHPPQILVNDSSASLYAFGTFRRWFVSVGAMPAAILTEDVASENDKERDSARALLAHELAHFVNGDMWRAALSRSLLKMTMLVALASLWISVSFVAIMVQIGPEITQESFWVELARLSQIPGLDLRWLRTYLHDANPAIFDLLADPTRAGETWSYLIFYLSNIFLPYLLAVPILYLFFWRKLMRVREFYADARAAELVGGPQPVERAMILSRALGGMKGNVQGFRARFDAFRSRIAIWLSNRSLLAYHPTNEERKKALAEPMLVFGKAWRIALWTGIATLLLEMILRSSLTLPYIVQPGAYLPLLTATIVFSVWLLPRVCQGESIGSLARTIVIMALVFILTKLTFNFLDLLFVGAAMLLERLDAVGAILDIYLRSMLGGAGANVDAIFGSDFGWSQILDWHILRPIVYYLLFGFPLLVASLVAIAWLQQRALTWYALGQRVKRVFWGILGVVLLFSILVLIPVGNWLFFPMFYDISWWMLLGMLVGVLILLLGVSWFLFFQRKWAGHCPKCADTVPDHFALGKACPHCGELLHDWLLVTY